MNVSILVEAGIRNTSAELARGCKQASGLYQSVKDYAKKVLRGHFSEGALMRCAVPG
jgi:hypothetical protein